MKRFKNVLFLLAALGMGVLGSSLTAMVRADGETTTPAIFNLGSKQEIRV